MMGHLAHGGDLMPFTKQHVQQQSSIQHKEKGEKMNFLFLDDVMAVRIWPKL